MSLFENLHSDVEADLYFEAKSKYQYVDSTYTVFQISTCLRGDYWDLSDRMHHPLRSVKSMPTPTPRKRKAAKNVDKNGEEQDDAPKAKPKKTAKQICDDSSGSETIYNCTKRGIITSKKTQ